MTGMLHGWRPLIVWALVLGGCTATPPMAGPILSEQAALDQLERSSETARNAVVAIDKARAAAVGNLKNAHTVGFKASMAILHEGGSVRIRRDFSQGAMEATSRPLDLAIQGQGFFQVRLGENSLNGNGYTRNGSFIVNRDGQICLDSGQGNRLDPPITVPTNATEIMVGCDGRVTAQVLGVSTPQMFGQIQIARFANPDGLLFRDDGMCLATQESGFPEMINPGSDGVGQLQQGALESSNVDVAREAVRLADLDRWRESLLKALNGRRR